MFMTELAARASLVRMPALNERLAWQRVPRTRPAAMTGYVLVLMLAHLATQHIDDDATGTQLLSHGAIKK